MTAEQRIHAMLEDPAAHDWMKQAARTALTKDACDVVTGLEWLAEAFRERLDQLIAAR